MPDLSTYMNVTPNEIPDPIVLPTGRYEFVVRRYRNDRVGQNNTELNTVILTPVRVVQAEDVTDEDLALAEPVEHQFWMTKAALGGKNGPVISAKRWLLDILQLDGDLPFDQLFELAIGSSFEAFGEKKNEEYTSKKTGKLTNINKFVVTRMFAPQS